MVKPVNAQKMVKMLKPEGPQIDAEGKMVKSKAIEMVQLVKCQNGKTVRGAKMVKR